VANEIGGNLELTAIVAVVLATQVGRWATKVPDRVERTELFPLLQPSSPLLAEQVCIQHISKKMGLKLTSSLFSSRQISQYPNQPTKQWRNPQCD
jgi:hypothetical protein